MTRDEAVAYWIDSSDADIAAGRVSRAYGANELDEFFADMKKHKWKVVNC